MEIQSFRRIIEGYKAIFLDSYGVLKNSSGTIPGAPQIIQTMEDKSLQFYILTNDASRNPTQLAAQFKQRGISNIPSGRIITSGMMASAYLKQKVKKGKVAFMGTTNSSWYIESIGLQAVHLNELDNHRLASIDAFVFLDDEGFDWFEGINRTINLIRERNIPVVIANTDDVYPVARNKVNLAVGGVAKMIENVVNKRFIYFGKPDSNMFMYALNDLHKWHSISRDEILMVGDTLHTDILGGNKFGLDTALVLSGNTNYSQAGDLIKSTGIVPTYICESIGN